MAINLIGPLLIILLIASAIGVSVGIVKKNKKLLLISLIVLVAIIAIYLLDLVGALLA